MRTRLQRLLDSLGTLRREATSLAAQDYEPSECSALLKDAGGTVETFLKAEIFPGRTRAKFVKLIDDLAAVGVAPADLQALHNLRDAYNDAKHTPTYAPTAADVVTILSGAISVFERWRGRALGTTETPVVAVYRRVLWLAAWDHFIHGDGEIQVFAPATEEDDFAKSVDVVYVKGLAWPDVLQPLGHDVSLPHGLIPQKFLDQWEAEGDYAGSRVFTGEYRELIRTLAAAELRLEGLIASRDRDAAAMRNAIALATVDVASTWRGTWDEATLKEQILHEGAAQYAAPRASRLAQGFAGAFGRLIAKIPSSTGSSVTGPRFVSEKKYEELRRSARALGDGIIISASYELIVAP